MRPGTLVSDASTKKTERVHIVDVKIHENTIAVGAVILVRLAGGDSYQEATEGESIYAR